MRSPMAEDAQSADKRASMQDWRSFPYFLTDEVWSMLCSSQSQLKKVDGLVNHLLLMGLRNASEPTQGLIAAVIGRHELDGSRFAALLATVKSVLKTHTVRARQSGKPFPAGLRLDVLPQLPEQLPEEFARHVAPNGFAKIPEGVDIEAIHQVARSCGVRSTHRTRVLSQQMVRGDSMPGLGGPMVSGFAQGFMSAMMQGASWAGREEVGLRNLQFLNRDPLPTSSRRQDDLARLLNRAQEGSADASSSVSAPTAASQAALTAPPQTALALLEPTQCSQVQETENVLRVTGSDLPAKESLALSQKSQSVEILEKKPNDPKASTGVETEEHLSAKTETSVAAGVAMLAQAHYQKELESDPVQQPVKKRGRPPQKGHGKGMKRPASCVEPEATPVASQDIPKNKATEKKGTKPPGKPSTPAVGKRPAGRSAKSSKQTKEAEVTSRVMKSEKEKPLTHAMRRSLRPKGCATCRATVGCCPSCWKKRGYVNLVD